MKSYTVKDVLQDYLGDQHPAIFKMSPADYFKHFKCYPGTKLQNVNLRHTYKMAIHFDEDHFNVVEAFRSRLTESFKCRSCGCTDDDCRQCIEKTGEPCYWVKEDLCSACEKQ